MTRSRLTEIGHSPSVPGPDIPVWCTPKRSQRALQTGNRWLQLLVGGHMKLPRRQFLRMAAGAAALPTMTASDLASGQPQAPHAQAPLVRNAQAAVAALEENARAWLSRNPSRLERRRSELAEALSSRDVKSLNVALYRAYDLAFALSMEGAIRVLDGSSEGWKSLGSTVEYFYYAERLAHTRNKAGGYLYQSIESPERFALTTLLAVCLGFDERARWLGNELLLYYDAGTFDAFSEVEPASYTYWQTLLKVFLTRRWPGPDDAGGRLGLYRPLFVAREMPQLKKSLLDACEYHLRKTGIEGDRDGFDLVYSWAPFGLMPVELFAYFKLRGDMQLPEVSVAHPLLSTPLARIPAQVLLDGDELLVRLSEIEKSAFGVRD